MTENKRVFLDITVNGLSLGRIVIELFCEIAPKTTENFRQLCVGNAGLAKDGRTKLSYKNVSIHRIVRGFMIQGGDISGREGCGGFSIYGECFDDEHFVEKHSKYVVSMANKGPNTNSSQFFITTSEASHCDGKHVVFGKVVKGFDVVDALEKIRVDQEDKPMMDVMISNCGELFRKKNNTKNEKNEDDRVENNNNHKQQKEQEEEEEEDEKEEDKEYIPETPKSWLYREDNNESRSSKRERGREKGDRRERSRSRSRSRNRDRDYQEPRHDSSGVRIKGRGHVMFRRDRSSTPEHWRVNAPTRKFNQHN
ncbi:unnamed protein product [Caenorhabditis angaria]|uniref:peptidylprolyl isomerase n=1 Tax=Caenorhabditis angaria TaxID=860376 RepID=A0A9P1ICE1_9PELO|nr:unnamed protein product [Caenorhabditis angaria]